MHFSIGRDEPFLYLATTKDGGVLLDIKNDRLLKLNTSSVTMWTLLSEGISLEDISSQLAEKYQVEAGRVRESLDALLRAANELGLDPRNSVSVVKPETQAPDLISAQDKSFPWYGQSEQDVRPRASWFLVIKALCGLALFDAILSFYSFSVMCGCVKRCKMKRRYASRENIGEVCAAVERACVWYPKKALCLQRSAVTACLLRMEGIDARMVVGVRAIPFLAHAWVESQGAVVNDWPRVRAFYPPIVMY